MRKITRQPRSGKAAVGRNGKRVKPIQVFNKNFKQCKVAPIDAPSHYQPVVNGELMLAATGGTDLDQPPAPNPARLRHLAKQIHALGPWPLYHLLRELVADADPLPTLEAYARLAPLASFIAEHEGHRLAGLRLIAGGATDERP